MPDLLLELRSEEIPARMQARAAADLERLVNERLLGAGFLPEGVKAFATPRRLALVAAGLPGRQPDRRDEKKGPRVGAPQAAIDGFLKSAGLSSLEGCETREDKKGAYYVALVEEKGRPTAEVVAGFMPDLIRNFPWPKSMRWGEGDLRWVRPLQSILCAFDGEIVAFEAGGVAASDESSGHRTLAPGTFRARSFDRYAAELAARKVTLDGARRAEAILADAKTLCAAQGLELVEDQGLLAEVAGLAEWPVAMMGAFDEKFLAVPDEALTASMRGHQKYFSVRNPKTGRLASRFIFVANIEAKDGGAAMRKGYERVLTARLSDAWYLYHQDRKTRLEDRLPALDQITFFEGLGTTGDKAERIAALAEEIAPALGAERALAGRAARLAKADLVSQMVREFPELQGVMGRYYALAEGEPAAVADAIRDHYRPLGAEDAAPTAPVSAAVALADKIDTLAAFWAIGKKPTGSSDPFALRRAALGIIRILTETGARIRLFAAFEHAIVQVRKTARAQSAAIAECGAPALAADLLEFVHDRLKVALRDRGFRHDLVDAVRANPLLAHAPGSLEDDLVLIVRKLEALDAFLKTEDGANLAAGYKRAANILKAEEKKGPLPAAADVNPGLLQQAEEKALSAALETAIEKAGAAAKAEKFEAAMAALAALRAPIDAFFEKVTVNADDPALRRNRLALLARFRAATATVADLSKLEG